MASTGKRSGALWVGAALSTLAMLGCAEQVTGALPTNSWHEPLSEATPIESYTLTNGLVVVLNADRRVPLVAVRVVYRLGAVDNPPSQPDLTHLIEHLLFRGSRHVEGNQHLARLNEAGAVEVNGTTSPDRTDLWEVVPANELALTLWLERERMASGLETVSDATVDTESRIVRQEMSERRSEPTNDVLSEVVVDQLVRAGKLSGDPRFHLGEPGAGDAVMAPRSPGDTISPDAVREFFRSRYGPNNALLVLCGDFDVAVAKRWIDHYFATIPARTLPARPNPVLVPGGGRTQAVEAAVLRPKVIMSWVTPASFAPGNAELDVVAEHLAFRQLRRAVVQDKALARSVTVEQVPTTFGNVFQIRLDVRSGVAASEVVAATDAALDDLRNKGIDFGDRYFAVESLLWQLYLEHDDLARRSWLVAQSQLGAGDPRFLAIAMRRYRSVTPASIAAAVAKFLRAEQRLLTLVSPRAKGSLAGEKAVGP